jgi:hypothetical protein
LNTTTSRRNSHRQALDYLQSLAAQWRQSGELPDAAGTLSGGEFRALAFASGKERILDAPVRDFLLLDDWLQCWVLETWGQQSLIGTRIGCCPEST